MSNPVGKVLDWLRAGYPEGVPPKDVFPLIALLRRQQLTDDEVREVAAALATEHDGGPISPIDIGALITKVTNELPHPDDVARVGSRLVAGGWPLVDPHRD